MTRYGRLKERLAYASSSAITPHLRLSDGADEEMPNELASVPEISGPDAMTPQRWRDGGWACDDLIHRRAATSLQQAHQGIKRF